MANEEDGVRHTLVFDPETSELLAEQQVALPDNLFGYPEGTVVGHATYLPVGVDRVGQRP
jgi:hypothetical protein